MPLYTNKNKYLEMDIKLYILTTVKKRYYLSHLPLYNQEI